MHSLGLKKNLLVYLATSLICILVLPSCRKSTAHIQCANVVKAIEKFQLEHLSTRPELSDQWLRAAFERVLVARGLQSNDSQKSLLLQCINTIDTIRSEAPRLNLDGIGTEMLDYYVRNWDPHSNVVSEFEVFSQSSLRTGFGFILRRAQQNLDFAEVVDVIGGSPAHAAGLREGMLVSAINGFDLKNTFKVDPSAVLNSSANPFQGNGLKIQIAAPSGETLSFQEVNLSRDNFEISPIKMDMLRIQSMNKAAIEVATIAYVRFREFSRTQGVFAEWLKSLKYVDGLIIDLRNLTGGDLLDVADIADLLVADGDTFAQLVERKDIESSATPASYKTIRFKNSGAAWNGPIVILVNAATKSAAELLAGTLQDYGAFIVGQPTFGKGTKQSVRQLTDFQLSGRLNITDAFIVRPSGKPIQFQGVIPNFSPKTKNVFKREFDYLNSLSPPKYTNAAPDYLEAMQNRDALRWISPLSQFKMNLFTNSLERHLETNFLHASEDDKELEAAQQSILYILNQTLSSKKTTK